MPRPVAEDGDARSITDELDLSDAQIVGLNAILNDYWSQWRSVQQLEFTSFAATFDDVKEIPWKCPDRGTVRLFLVQKQHVRQSLYSIEQALFGSISELITDRQLTMLDSLRRKRNREFQMADPLIATWFWNQPLVDLHNLLACCTQESQQVLDAPTMEFDGRSEQVLRRLEEAVDRARSCWVDQIDKSTFVAIPPNASTEQRHQHRDAIHTWSDCLHDASLRASEYLELIQKTVDQFTLLVPESDARSLHANYYYTFFEQSLGQDCKLQWTLEEAARSEQIDEENRARISIMLDQWLAKARPLQNLIAQGLTARQTRLPHGLNVGIGAPNEAELAYRDSVLPLQDLRRQTEKDLEALVAPDLLREIRRCIYGAHCAGHVDAGQVLNQKGMNLKDLDGCGMPSCEDVYAISVFMNDGLLIDAIRGAITPLAQQYKDASAKLRLANIPLAPSELRSGIDKTQERLDAWQSALQEVASADGAFLDALRDAGSSDKILTLIRLHLTIRLTRWMHHACNPVLLGTPPDIVAIAARLTDVDPRVRGEMASLVLKHADDLINLLTTEQVALKGYRAAAIMNESARWLRPAPDERVLESAWEAVSRVQLGFQNALDIASRATLANHRQVLRSLATTIDEICQLASFDENREIRIAVTEATFPIVFDNLIAVRTRLQKAMTLSTASNRQRDDIANWSIDFHQRFEAWLQDAMRRLWSYAFLDSSMPSQSIVTLEIEQLRVEQRRLGNDLNATLQRIFDPEQLESIGLPSAAKSSR